jgi:RimJ/RimL family protein N-acetyltransferase
LDVSRLEDFVALTADPDTMRYWAPDGPHSRDVAERSFAASLARVREHGFGRRWIVAKENGAGLGFTDTKYFGQSCDDVSPDEVEIGWMLTPPAWGQGYATEAGSAVRDEAFDRLKLERHPDGSWRSSEWRSSATSSLRTVGRFAFTA